MVEVKLAPIDIKGRIFEADIATIKSTMLGIEDHGWLTFDLQLDYGTGGQGVGSFMLDHWDSKKDKNVPLLWTAAVSRKILEVAGVDEWEHLKGCRIIALKDEPYGVVRGLMNLPPAKNNYVIFEDIFQEYKSQS